MTLKDVTDDAIGTTDGSEPLFVLPEYESAGRRFFVDAMHALMRARDPVLGMMHFEMVDSLSMNRVTIASDQVIDTATLTVEASFALSRSDTIAGRLDTFYVALSDAAESGLASMMPQFFSNVSDICDAAGQTVVAGEHEMNLDLLREAMESIEITFNDDGSPNLPTLVVHPTVAERLAELPPPTAEQERRFDEMMERKRREFFDRRRTRRLPRHPD